jgi:uncharacterized protein (UPF0548 family)
VFRLLRPTDSEIAEFLKAQKQLRYTYESVGATAATPPAKYVLDQTRTKLGNGEGVFLRAKGAMRGWRQFDLGWVEAAPLTTDIQPNAVVAIVARTFGLWSLNAARIVYVVDEPRRFGFAYGTLPGHVEQGEERFLIEWSADDAVWYDIVAFSRPGHILLKIGYPLGRLLQKRFARESAAAMSRI